MHSVEWFIRNRVIAAPDWRDFLFQYLRLSSQNILSAKGSAADSSKGISQELLGHCKDGSRHENYIYGGGRSLVQDKPLDRDTREVVCQTEQRTGSLMRCCKQMSLFY